MVVMVAGVLSHYSLFSSFLCVQCPQLQIALLNNVEISFGADGWQRGAVKIVCVWMIIHEMAFVAGLAQVLIPKLELL